MVPKILISKQLSVKKACYSNILKEWSICG